MSPDTALPCTLREAANHEPRKGNVPIDMLVLHYTGMVSGEAALKHLCAADSGVSCHYLVFEDGRIVQMVAESERAWHAGKAFWRGETDINSRSIGIEIVNPGHEFGYRPFPEVQIDAVRGLCTDIVARHPIPPRNVVAHSDIAPERKEDPGELFPWGRLHRTGIGHWVEPESANAGGPDSPVLEEGATGPEVSSLQKMLADYGYGIATTGVYDSVTKQVVTAFQRHFRQARVDGRADVSTVAMLKRLVEALGEGAA
ncbi:MAG: N-acetylmuramoyl-L-alanine amidase [Salaquimonas sp.]|nr:N-acetylmuramoyl-L-alanine amidase [Salaquimonas sp.]